MVISANAGESFERKDGWTDSPMNFQNVRKLKTTCHIRSLRRAPSCHLKDISALVKLTHLGCDPVICFTLLNVFKSYE